VVVRVEHCIGDGMALSEVFRGLFTDPEGNPVESDRPLDRRPTSPVTGRPIHRAVKRLKGALVSLWEAGQIAGGPFDSVTPFCRGDLDVTFSSKQRVLLIPTHPLATVQRIRAAAGGTVNDVVFGCLSGAISRYLRHAGRDPSSLTLRAIVAVGLPSDLPATKLANTWTFVSVPLSVAPIPPAARLRHCTEIWNVVKASPFAYLMVYLTSALAAFTPLSIQRLLSTNIVARHSFVFSNVPGFTRPVALCGRVLVGVRMVYINLVPQFTLLSYNGQLYGTIVVDPTAVPDAHLLPDFYMQELADLAVAHGVSV
jgi:diacylglycerol O-acyltransferase